MPFGRGVALALVGLWLGTLIASWVAATASFRNVDRVLGPGMRPELASKLASVAPDDRRMVLRHLASEINRWTFRRLAFVQVAVALAALGAAWPARGVARGALIGAAAIALVQMGAGAAIESLGRALDFLPRPLPATAARRFGAIHGAFVLLDLLKAAVLVLAGHALARAPLQ